MSNPSLTPGEERDPMLDVIAVHPLPWWYSSSDLAVFDARNYKVTEVTARGLARCDLIGRFYAAAINEKYRALSTVEEG